MEHTNLKCIDDRSSDQPGDFGEYRRDRFDEVLQLALLPLVSCSECVAGGGPGDGLGDGR